MIEIWVSQEVFRYDADSLVKAFFPGRVVKNHLLENISSDILRVEIRGDKIKSIVIEIFDSEKLSKPELRNQLKREMYTELKEATGRELPWGALTGVRPVRLAARLLREKNDPAGAEEALKELYFVSSGKAGLAVEIAQRQREVLRRIHPETDFGGVLPSYSLYVGIPFCPSRCTYCSFASYPMEKWKDRIGEYFQALEKELEFVRDIKGGEGPDTIYIGGGTPTSLDEGSLEKLLELITAKIKTTEAIEYTLEAGRPDTITREKLRIMKRYGIGRICVNPQTMNDRTLEQIGRRHSANNIRDAFALARQEGFGNINMDIILGLPGENVADVKYTLDEIAKLKPDDLTVHSLALKRGSVLKEEWMEGSREAETAGKADAVPDITGALRLASDSAADMGLKPYYLYRQKNISGNYENTGFARPGAEGIYNMVIMEEVQSLIACGAGTVSKKVSSDGKSISRCDTPKDLEQYISRIDEMVERKRMLFTE